MYFITAIGLVKNTVLGIVVFEVYGATVDTLTSLPSVSNDVDETLYASTSTTASSTWLLQGLSNNNHLLRPVMIHSLGGFVGGSAHGVVAAFWDSISITMQHECPKLTSNRLNPIALRGYLNPALVLFRKNVPGMIAHHGLSHAVLFGSYELSKRLIISHWTCDSKRTYHDNGDGENKQQHDNSTDPEPMVKVEYLAHIFLAGGLAGQAQHIASRFTEKWFLSHSNSACHSWRAVIFPLIMSSFPSSIAFVAFEYSRNI